MVSRVARFSKLMPAGSAFQHGLTSGAAGFDQGVSLFQVGGVDGAQDFAGRIIDHAITALRGDKRDRAADNEVALAAPGTGRRTFSRSDSISQAAMAVRGRAAASGADRDFGTWPMMRSPIR